MNTKIVSRLFPLFLIFVACGASAVERGTSGLTSFKTLLDTWVPIVAGICVILCGASYWFQIFERNYIIQFAKGLLVIGAGSYVVSLFVS